MTINKLNCLLVKGSRKMDLHEGSRKEGKKLEIRENWAIFRRKTSACFIYIYIFHEFG